MPYSRKKLTFAISSPDEFLLFQPILFRQPRSAGYRAQLAYVIIHRPPRTFACTVSSELLGFWFWFFHYFSFLGRALDLAGHVVSFWAHVNLPYRIKQDVNCRRILCDVVQLRKTRTVRLFIRGRQVGLNARMASARYSNSPPAYSDDQGEGSTSPDSVLLSFNDKKDRVSNKQCYQTVYCLHTYSFNI